MQSNKIRSCTNEMLKKTCVSTVIYNAANPVRESMVLSSVVIKNKVIYDLLLLDKMAELKQTYFEKSEKELIGPENVISRL